LAHKYTFHDQQELYFVTFTVIKWIDIFTRDDYRLIFADSIRHCQQHKGLNVYAWVIMTNHVHMIIGRNSIPGLSDIIRDLKSFTSRHIRKAIENNSAESRDKWVLKILYREGMYNPRNRDFQLWIQDNHPILLDTKEKLFQRLNYLHNNPVKAGFVCEPQHWKWSSAGDYCGFPGPIETILIE